MTPKPRPLRPIAEKGLCDVEVPKLRESRDSATAAASAHLAHLAACHLR